MVNRKKYVGAYQVGVAGAMLLVGSIWNFSQGRADIGMGCLVGSILFGLVTAALVALARR